MSTSAEFSSEYASSDAAHTAPDVAGVGVGELLKNVTTDLSTLVNQEIELAKLEIRQEVKKTATIAGGFAGAGFAGSYVVLFLSLTLMFALATAFSSFTWGALVVAVIWALIGLVLFLRARATAKTLNGKPEVTIETLKEDKEWLQTRKS